MVPKWLHLSSVKMVRMWMMAPPSSDPGLVSKLNCLWTSGDWKKTEWYQITCCGYTVGANHAVTLACALFVVCIHNRSSSIWLLPGRLQSKRVAEKLWVKDNYKKKRTLTDLKTNQNKKRRLFFLFLFFFTHHSYHISPYLLCFTAAVSKTQPLETLPGPNAYCFSFPQSWRSV